MKSIEEQIEALTQKLRPYPTEPPGIEFWIYDGRIFSSSDIVDDYGNFDSGNAKFLWGSSLFASTNKAEVEEYADCYKRLKLYQLLGKKAEKEFTLKWLGNDNYGTDFFYREHGQGYRSSSQMLCVLGGVWFSREEDRLEALKICGIDKTFQEKCAKYGIGGA